MLAFVAIYRTFVVSSVGANRSINVSHMGPPDHLVLLCAAHQSFKFLAPSAKCYSLDDWMGRACGINGKERST